MTAPPNYYDGLGASICGAIMGEDPNRSPYDVWREFTDPAARPNLDDNEAVEAGVMLEPAVAQWTAKRLGVQLDYQPGRLIKHPTLPFMQCHPDALVLGEAAGMEVKNRGLQTARVYASLDDFAEDMDRAQATEVLQCYASLACNPTFTHWYLGVAVGGQKLLTFKIMRDNAIIEPIERRYEEFWGYVERHEPPPPINTSDCAKLWPSHVSGSFVEATEVVAAAVEERKRLKKIVKEANDRLEFEDFKIQSFMQDAEELRVGGKKVLTWREQERGGYEVKPTRFRVMR
jgi:predicted phage-related endonuclease